MAKTRRQGKRATRKVRKIRKGTRKMRGGVNTYYSQGIANSRINKRFLNAKHSINFGKKYNKKINNVGQEELNKKLHSLIQDFSRKLPTMCFSGEDKNMTDIITINISKHGEALAYLIEIIKGQKGTNNVVSKGVKMLVKLGTLVTGSTNTSLGKEETIRVLQELKDTGKHEGKTCNLYSLRVRLTRMFPNDISKNFKTGL